MNTKQAVILALMAALIVTAGLVFTHKITPNTGIIINVAILGLTRFV